MASHGIPIYVKRDKLPIEYVEVGNEYEWVRASLLSSTANGSTIVLRGNTTKGSSNVIDITTINDKEASILRANDESFELEEDLINLTHLHEPAVVEILENRYEKNFIYTGTGSILLALNPFRQIPKLYDEKAIKLYKDQNFSPNGIDALTLPPHVYRTAQTAYSNIIRMASNSRNWNDDGGEKNYLNQSILVSGESGAGKTMTTKFIMGYLAKVSSKLEKETGEEKKVNFGNGIERRILQSNPILESFGNARTIRNDNSSRFGKFIEIRFHEGVLIGAHTQTYLLEKVRLVTQSPGERNYHIFYELLESVDQKEKRDFGFECGCSPGDFILTNQSGTYDRRDGVKDEDTYKLLEEAFAVMNFNPTIVKFIKGIVASVLHLGNIAFVEKVDGSSEISSDSNISLKNAANLLGVSSLALITALTRQTIITPSESISSPLTSRASTLNLQALFKGVYKGLFEWIVKKINSELAAESLSNSTSTGVFNPSAWIGILDIFGFESFESNSFEQLCINYTNETLQQQFNNYILKKEQALYEEEEIIWINVEYRDNVEVLNAINGKTVSIFGVLDLQCRLPKTNDETFFRGIYALTKDSTASTYPLSVSNAQFPRLCFTVNHYAGSVEYNATGFLSKNQDSAVLNYDAIRMFETSTNIFVRKDILPYVSGQIDDIPKSPRKRKTSNIMKQSVCSQFSDQLSFLKSKIDNTSPHYVRCLKPNGQLIPDNFVSSLIATQLRCAGVLEAVHVSRLGYPQRYTQESFVKRYRVLIPSEEHGVENTCVNLTTLLTERLRKELSNLCDRNADFIQMGRTKVFLTQTAFDCLECLRQKELDSSAIVVQTLFRMYFYRAYYLRARVNVITIQGRYRIHLATKLVQLRRSIHSASKVQQSYRRHIARKKYVAVLYLATWSQRFWRGTVDRAITRDLYRKVKAVVIQAYVRRLICMQKYDSARKSTITLQCFCRSLASRKLLRMLKLEQKDLKKIREENLALKREILRFRKLQDSSEICKQTTSAEANGSHEVVSLESDIAMKQVQALSAEIDRLKQLCKEKDEEILELRNRTWTQPRQLSLLEAPIHVNDVSFQSSVIEQTQPTRVHCISALPKVQPALYHQPPTIQHLEVSESTDDIQKTELSCSHSKFDHVSSPSVLSGSSQVHPAVYHQPPIKQHLGVSESTDDIQNTELSWSHSKSDHGTSPHFVNESSHKVDVSSRAFPPIKEDAVFPLIKEGTSENHKHTKEVAFTNRKLNRQESNIHVAVYAHDEKALLEAVYEYEPSVHSHNDNKVPRVDSSSSIALEVNRGDYEGKTPLHVASVLGDLKMGTILLFNMAVANAQDNMGNTPLHFSKNSSFTKLLFVIGNANPNIPNENGLCALHLAVTRRDVECVRVLLQYGADVNAADDVNWYGSLHLIAQCRSNINEDEEKMKGLPVTNVDKSFDEIVQMLCSSCEVDLDSQDNVGNTALHHAAVLDGNDGGAVMRCLLEKGANPNIKNSRGQTPLLLLSYNRAIRKQPYHNELLCLLLEKGADVNIESAQSGCAPLHLLLYYRDIHSSVMIMRQGAQLHMQWKRPPSWNAFWSSNVDGDCVDPLVLPWHMLIEKTDRLQIINAISVTQDWCKPTYNCMSCKSVLRPFGKHHCRHCGRCICAKCSPTILDKNYFPSSMRDKLKFSKNRSTGFRVCLECETVLRTRMDEISTPCLSLGEISHLHVEKSGKPSNSTLGRNNSQEETSEDQSNVSSFRSKVFGLVDQVAPHEVGNIDDMIQVFEGREDELLDLLDKRKQDRDAILKTVIKILSTYKPSEANNADEMLRIFSGRENEFLDILESMKSFQGDSTDF